ncbi:arginine N-succinyltransferase [Andreprevotia lacus DSM 23236]|jgi:arginine N-succinyltransferase|uniref:Arginine N-succinyltransferase n=1 Tax=Andreprevotia lacus DSM 23236 TaxID=1121001 RepID=A0A1W1XDK1_9NEIS|nr:arginine N-succinyltransferase [Andreprevotia lacus]SMC22016.1 arginine N-succinyltransferase [Andreprevotia lacus DSM 23236]
MRIRLLKSTDLHAVVALAGAAGVGVTTLQPDPERLAARIAGSEASTADERELAEAGYFFALEDEVSGALAGTAAIEAAVGLADTWYNYRVGLSVHASRELGIYKQMPTLFLTSDLTGASELCSLFLHPDWRRDGNGSLLSKSRFLFMAEYPERFSERVIAEMRGVSDEAGRSPFWESLGRHFFRMDFARADFLSYVGSKSFIAELMPKYPIYTALLSDEAQAVIGEVHPATKPARSLLESEGFRYQGYIDIFDAGPTLECSLGDVRAIKDSATYHALAVTSDTKGGTPWLVSNRRLGGFCATVAITRPLEDALPLTQAVLDRLEIADGDSVRAVPLSAKE